ncbi:MAG: glycosyl hydrolase family 35 [Puniceicoccaceae bacterium]|nr:MAG: glycosyl hydrolase family 35 [Puniceicoccaceae bacterium]
MIACKLNPVLRPKRETFRLGSQMAPDGRTLDVDALSLLYDGRRWLPVMGELHFTRLVPARWAEALSRMRAGGITIASTYVFWIHHEEVRGESDWSEGRDLRRFVTAAVEAGLLVVVRIGPWCHGEVRNGGLPDWVAALPGARSDNPTYLAAVRRHFAAIHGQLDGLYWKQGGPVIACQLENEYGGPGEHLLTLKRLAREAGIDVPYYTRTGWPELATPLRFGELLPLYGAYAEGFWDRELSPMPGFYPAGFRFSPLRTDAAIATDLLGRREAAGPPDTQRYPFLTCELGGGMMSSYHRRLRIDPRDIESVALTKLGSGGNLPGYYMYHGGTNPDGRLTSLQETQATGYWNDLPEKNYDFQAPVGAAGQVREHYHRLRRLHRLVQVLGAELAGWPAQFPGRTEGRENTESVRWSVRGDGHSGLVLVSNHERGRALPDRREVQFALRRTDGSELLLPSRPVTLPSGQSVVWPFGWDLVPGVCLDHATAWPLGSVEAADGRTVFLGAVDGVPVELAVNGEPPRRVDPGRRVAAEWRSQDSTLVRMVVLDETDSLALWFLPWRGRERALLASGALRIEGRRLLLTCRGRDAPQVAVYPPIDDHASAGRLFDEIPMVAEGGLQPAEVGLRLLREAGPPREIPLGWTTPPVAVAPEVKDFEAAAAWEVRLPGDWGIGTTPRLRFFYRGDVARVLLGGHLVLDDFYNGDPLEFDLRPHAEVLAGGERLIFEVLPLRADAPILLPESVRPAVGEPPVARLDGVELVKEREVEL